MNPSERVGCALLVSLKAGASVTPEEVVAFTKERMAAYKYPRLCSCSPPSCGSRCSAPT